jgi:salicylate hydroxylase
LLAKIDLLDDALAIAGSRNRVWLSFRRYDNGEEIVTIPIKETGKLKQLPVQRAEFLELLYQTILKRGAARLHTNKACRKLEVRYCGIE